MLIRCPGCNTPLCELVAGIMIVRHHRREIVGIAYSIRCERCGTVWTPVSQTTGNQNEQQGQSEANRGVGAPTSGS